MPSAEFRPKPYEFRIENPNHTLSSITPDDCLKRGVKFPNFNLWFDHTIAVVWLCSLPEPQIGSLTECQLQWALRMLRSIQTIQGPRNPDISSAIRRMEKIELKLCSDKYADTEPKGITSVSTLDLIQSEDESVERPRLVATQQNSLMHVVSRFCPEKLVHLLGEAVRLARTTSSMSV